MRVGLALASGTLLRIASKNIVLISVVSKKLKFLSLPLLPGGLGLVSGPPLWGSRVVKPFRFSDVLMVKCPICVKIQMGEF